MELAIIPLAIFSFIATEASWPTEARYSQEYSFDVSAERLEQLIRELPGPTRLVQESGVYFEFYMPWECTRGLMPSTRVLGNNIESDLFLDRLTSTCHKGGWSSARLQRLFEDSVVTNLRGRISG